MKRSLSILLAGAVLALGASHAWALVIAPATPGLAGENVFPINGASTYCVSDFGWSDTWLVPAVAVYDQARDVLSGDDAGNLKYKIGGVPAETAHGWLTPSLDAGHLGAFYATGSTWVATTPLHYVVAGVTTNSVITQPAVGLSIDITTTIAGNLMQQTYIITNNGGFTLTDVDFADYFNFHPHGSINNGDYQKGTSVYLGADEIYTFGNPLDPSFIANGIMGGSLASANHEVDLQGNVLADVEAGVYLNNTGPIGPQDTAGALEWNLGVLVPTQSVSITVFKDLEVPEPASISLLGLGAVALLRRRRARWDNRENL